MPIVWIRRRLTISLHHLSVRLRCFIPPFRARDKLSWTRMLGARTVDTGDGHVGSLWSFKEGGRISTMESQRHCVNHSGLYCCDVWRKANPNSNETEQSTCIYTLAFLEVLPTHHDSYRPKQRTVLIGPRNTCLSITGRSGWESPFSRAALIIKLQ